VVVATVAFGSVGIVSPLVAPSIVDFYNEKINNVTIVVNQLVIMKTKPITIKFKSYYTTFYPLFFFTRTLR